MSDLFIWSSIILSLFSIHIAMNSAYTTDNWIVLFRDLIRMPDILVRIHVTEKLSWKAIDATVSPGNMAVCFHIADLGPMYAIEQCRQLLSSMPWPLTKLDQSECCKQNRRSADWREYSGDWIAEVRVRRINKTVTPTCSAADIYRQYDSQR